MFAQKNGRTRALLVLAGLLVVGFVFLMMTTGNAVADVDNDATSVDSANKEVEANKSVTYQVGVRLTKDGSSPYETDISLSLSTPTTDWSNEFVGGVSSWHVTNSGWKYTSVKITAPADAEVGDYEETYVTITNTNGTEEAPIYFRTDILFEDDVDIVVIGSDSRFGNVSEDVSFNLRIFNYGNGDDQIQINLTQTPGDLTTTFGELHSLAAGASKPVPVQVTIGRYATAKKYSLIFNAESVQGSDSETAQINITVNEDYTYSITVDDAAKNGLPNEWIEYNLTFNNSGNVRVDFDVTIVEDISPWTFSINPSSFTLDESDERVINVKVQPDDDALADTTIDTTVVIVPEVGKGTNTSIVLSTEVDQIFDVHLEGTAPSGKIMPGEWGNATITVVNDGNGEDTFSMLAQVPEDWGFNFDPSATLTVAGNSQDTLTLRVYVHEDASYGPHNVYCNATSTGDESVSSIPLALAVEVDQDYGVEIGTYGEANKAVDIQNQAKVIGFNFTITNDGNRQDTFTFEYVDEDSTGWGSITFSPTSIELDPDESAEIQFSVKVPVEYTAGDYQWTVRAQMGDSSYSAPLVFTVTVDQYYDFDIMTGTINATTSDLDPEGTVYVDLQVKNIGNDRATVEFDAVRPTGWDFYTFTPSSIVLDEAEETIIVLEIEIGEDALDDTYAVTVEAISKATLLTTDTYDVSINVNQVFDCKVTIPGVDSQHADPGEAITFTVRLHNEGNGEDNIKIEISNPAVDWTYEFSQGNPEIDANSNVNLTLTVTPPDDAAEDTYAINFNATTGPGNSVFHNTAGVTVVVDQLYDIGLTTPVEQVSSKPENTVYFYINVENKGTGPDSIEMEEVSSELPTEATVTLINTTHSITAGMVNRSTIRVDLPEKEDIDLGAFNITYQATSENGTAYDDTDDIVKEITFTIVIEPVYELFLTSSDVWDEVEPEQTVYFELQISNIGTGDSRFWVNKTGQGRSWATHEPVSPNIKAGDDKIAFLNITLPEWEDINPTIQNDGYFEIGLKVTCQKEPTVTDTVMFTVSIKPQYEVQIGQINPKSGLPGEMINYSIVITNKGTHTDTFNVTFGDIPTNWDVSFFDANDSRVRLDPEENEILGINITLPNDMDDAAEGDYFIDIEFESDGKGNDIASDVIEVNVDQFHEVELFTSGPSQDVEPGDKFDFVVKVSNEGNGNDVFSLAKQGTEQDWASIRSQADGGGQTLSSMTLDPEEEDFAYVWVEVPEDEDPGTYYVELNVSHDDGHRVMNLTIVIDETFDVEINSFTTSIVGDPGTSVTFTVRVKNTGDAEDTYSFELTDEMAGWSFEGNSTDVFDLDDDDINRTILTEIGPLDPEQLVLVYLTIPVPEKISGENIETGPHYINMTVQSIGDETKTDSIELNIDVDQFYKFRVTGDERKEVDAGDNVTFEITLENEGNDDDTYGLQIVLNEGGDEWTIGMANQITVNEGTFQTFEIDIDVPDDAESLEYIMVLRVRSQGDSDLSEDFNFTVKVNTLYDLDLQSPADTKTGRFEKNLTFQINVENKGNGEDTVHLLVSDGKLASYTYFSYKNTQNVDEIDIILENASVTHTVNVTVRIPNRDTIEDLYGDDTLASDRIQIKGYSLEDEDKEDYINLTVEFKAVFDFEIVETQDNIDVDANSADEAELAFEIQNEGTREDTYTILKLSSPQKMQVSIDYGGQKVQPGESEEIDVRVTLPANDNDIQTGSYEVEIEVTSRGDNDVVRTFILNFNIEEFSIDFELQPLDVNINWNPDPDEGTDEIDFNFRIKNTGTRDDAYTVDVVSNPFPGKVSFATTGYSGAKISNRTGQVDVTITMSRTGQPKDIEAGTPRLIVDVLSNGNTTVVETINFDFTVEQFYNLDLNIDQNEKDVKVEEMTEFEINVINKGNGDDTFDISASKVTPTNDWYVFARGAESGSSLQDININHDTEVTVKLQITPDIDEVLDEFDADDDNEITFEFSLVAEDGSTFPFGDADDKITATVIDVYRFELDLPAQLKQTITDPKEDEDVDFDITVRNTGISEDKYSVSYNTNNSFLDISHSFDVSGMIDDQAKLTVNILMDIDDTKNELWRVPAGDYDIEVTVESQEDDTQEEMFTVTVGIDTKADLEEERLDDDTTVEPGGNTTYTFKISNYGNKVDIAKVRLTDDENLKYGNLLWIDSQGVEKKGKSINVPIKVGGEELVDYIITGDKDDIQDKEIDEFAEKIQITSSIDSNERIDIDYRTEVEEKSYSISVAFSTSSAKVSPEQDDHNVTLQFDVENTGDDPDNIEIRVFETPDLEDSNLIPGDTSWVSLKYEDISGTGTSLTIEDMETGTPGTVFLEFDVGTIPVDAEEGKYSYMIAIESKGGGPGDTQARVWQNVTLEVEKVAGFELTIDITTAEIDPTGLDKQDLVEVPITIHNEGNFEDTFKLQTLGMSADLDVDFANKGDPATFQIDPDGEEVVEMELTADEDAREGTLSFQIRVSSSEGGTSQTETFVVTVLAADIRISKHDIKLDTSPSSVEKGDDVVVEVRVWNNGSGPIADLEVKFLIGSTVKDTFTIEELGADRFEDLTFDWDNVGDGKQSIRIQTTGAQPIEINVKKDYTFDEKTDELASGDLMMYVGGSLAGGLILGILIGMLLFGGRRKKDQPKEAAKEPAKDAAKPGAPPAPGTPGAPPAAPGKPGEPPKPGAPPAPGAAPAAAAGAAAGAAAAPPAGAKPVKVKCPKCGNIIDVKDPKRPLEIKCEKCAATLRLKQ